VSFILSTPEKNNQISCAALIARYSESAFLGWQHCQIRGLVVRTGTESGKSFCTPKLYLKTILKLSFCTELQICFEASWELCRIDFCHCFIIALISHQQVLEKPHPGNTEQKYKKGAY